MIEGMVVNSWWTPESAAIGCLLCGGMSADKIPKSVVEWLNRKMNNKLPSDCNKCINSQPLCG